MSQRNFSITDATTHPLYPFDAQGRGGRTAVYTAAEKGDVEMLTFLLDRGANANAAARGGSAPLMAVVSGNLQNVVEVVELLLANGANPNAFYTSERSRETAFTTTQNLA